MGHSSRGGGGSLKNFSSYNSAARFLQAFLCWGRCAIWHSRLQYFTNLHAVHDLRPQLISSLLPQLAHVMIVVDICLRTMGDVFGGRWSNGCLETCACVRCRRGDSKMLYSHRWRRQLPVLYSNTASTSYRTTTNQRKSVKSWPNVLYWLNCAVVTFSNKPIIDVPLIMSLKFQWLRSGMISRSRGLSQVELGMPSLWQDSIIIKLEQFFVSSYWGST